MKRPTQFKAIGLFLIYLSSFSQLIAQESHEKKAIDLFAAELAAQDKLPVSQEGLRFLGDTPLARNGEFSFKVIEGQPSQIEFSVNREAKKRIMKLLSKHKERKLALVNDGKIIFASLSQERLSDRYFTLSFASDSDFQKIKKALTS